MKKFNLEKIISFLLEDIKPENIKMYRELSMMFHPDRNPEGADKMAKLNALKDAGNWDAIKRLYMKYIATENEPEEQEFEKPNKPSELLKFYKNLADEIEEELANRGIYGIKIIPELQGNAINIWVNFIETPNSVRGQSYIPKADRFKTKHDLKVEIMKKLGIKPSSRSI